MDDKAFMKVDRFAGGEGSYIDWAYDIKMAVGARTRRGKRAIHC